MKNKQLFIIALLMVVGGVNFVSQSVQRATREQLHGLYLLEDSGYTLIYHNCFDDYGKDCETINKIFLAAKNHAKKKNEIAAMDESLAGIDSEYTKARVAVVVNDKKAAYLNYNKAFLATLSEADRKAFDEALENELAKVNGYAIGREAKAIEKIINC